MVEQKNEALERDSPELHSVQEEQLTLDFIGSGIRFLAIVAVLVLCYLAQPVLITLCVSVILAFVLAPVSDMLLRLRCPRPLAASLSVGLALLLFYSITYFSYDRALDFMEDLPRFAGKFRKTVLRVQRQAQTIQKTSESMLPELTGRKTALKVIPQTNWVDIMARNVGSLAASRS